MATTVSIFLTGLCYLVTNGAGNPVKVVFPTVDVPVVAETRPHGHKMTIPPHKTYVRYRPDQVVSTDTVPDVYFTRKGIGYAAYFLDGETIDVQLSPDGAQPVSFETTVIAPSNPPSRRDRLPFSMVIAPAKDVHGDIGKIDDAFVINVKTRDVVRGRLDINLGHLSASFADPRVTWQFKPEALDPAKKFVLPQMVAWDVKTTDGQVKLAFTPFNTADPIAHELTLRQNSDPIDLEIGNVPIDDLVGAGKPHTPDHHFEIYYRLLDERPLYLLIPYGTGLSPEGGNCPPVRETP